MTLMTVCCRFRIDMQYSLFDFIRGGMQIQPVVAIDFTVRRFSESCLVILFNELNTITIVKYLTDNLKAGKTTFAIYTS